MVKFILANQKNPNKRFKRHIYVSNHPNYGYNQFQPIHAAISKYGKDNFLFEIIDECILEHEIFAKEIYWIAHYKSNIIRYPDGNGYNLTDGGEGMSGLSPSRETRNKISQANSGENNGMFGRTHGSTIRQNMSNSQKNRACRPSLTEAHKQKKQRGCIKTRFFIQNTATYKIRSY